MDNPSQKTVFHLKRRRHLMVEAIFFLMFAGAAGVQVYVRLRQQTSQGWGSWWFYGLITLVFLFFAVESLQKFFFSRLVLTDEELLYYDFLKVTRLKWDEIKKVGEIELKNKKGKDFGLILKDAAVGQHGPFPLLAISLVPFFFQWEDSSLELWLKTHKPRLLK